MKNIYGFICAMALGLLMQTQAEVVFHDTFQAANNTAPNTDYALRQTAGQINSSYGLTTDGARVENTYRILDNDSDGESALTLSAYKPLGGLGTTSWTAARTAANFSSYLAGQKYAITLDSQFLNGGGNPAGFDTAFAVGILWAAGATTTPMSFASLFGVSLDGTGGGYDIYSAGTLLHHADTGSSIVWNERFTLSLVVDEAASTVQTLVQGIGDASATDLGTYTADFSSHPERIVQLYGSQTDNGSGAGGYLKIDTFETDVSTIPEPATLGLFGIAASGLLIVRRLRM